MNMNVVKQPNNLLASNLLLVDSVMHVSTRKVALALSYCALAVAVVLR